MLSPDSLHSPDVTSSLSSVESLRTSIPEEHRTLFDSLRKDIIDYCHANTIPVPSHVSLDAFEQTMRARRIPIPILEHLSFLLARLDYLAKHKKPIPPEQDPEFREAMEYANNRFSLSEQYREQVGLLEHFLMVQDGAIVGGNNERYPVPPVERIATRLFERREELEDKHSQGFTKLLLVPFGLPLISFQTALEMCLIEYRSSRRLPPLQRRKGFFSQVSLTLQTDYDARPDILYASDYLNPYGVFDKTKLDILRDQSSNPQAFTGWHVRMLQTATPRLVRGYFFAPIPPRGEGGGLYGLKHPRPDIATGRSVDSYLSLFKGAQIDEASPYFGERGMTPEDWFMAFMTQVRESDLFLDTDTRCLCLGSIFHSTGKIPAFDSAQSDFSGFGVRLEPVSSDAPSSFFGPRTLINI